MAEQHVDGEIYELDGVTAAEEVGGMWGACSVCGSVHETSVNSMPFPYVICSSCGGLVHLEPRTEL